MGRASVARPAGSFAYPILLALGALDAAAYSLIAPVTPAIARATGTGPGAIGVLVAAFPLGIMLGFLVAGREVARRGPRWVLLASLVVVAAGGCGFLLWDSYLAYLMARFVMGVGSGGLWLGIAFDTLERWPGSEYLCMSRIFAAYSVGGLVGPALGTIGGIRGPFAAYLGLVVLVSVLVPFMGEAPERRRFRPDRSALRAPGFWAASAGVLFAVLGLGIIEGILPLHLSARFDQRQIGILFVASAVVNAVAATSAGRLPPRRTLLFCLVAVTAGIALAGAGGGPAWWIPALALAAAGIGSGEVGSIGILLEAIPPERIVTAMVVWSQLGIAGYLIGPLAAGGVVEALGFAWLGVVPLASAVAVFVALAVAARRRPS
jgi:MFS family permease